MTLSWAKLDNDVTDSCLEGFSVWIVLTSRMQFVNCPLTSAQLPLVMKSTSSVCRDIWLEILRATCSLVAILMFLVLRAFRKVRSWWWPMLIGLETSKTVAVILELQFGSKVLSKTRGIPCKRFLRSRTWFVWLWVNSSWWHWLVQLTMES